jgi:hypothetical protein
LLVILILEQYSYSYFCRYEIFAAERPDTAGERSADVGGEHRKPAPLQPDRPRQ